MQNRLGPGYEMPPPAREVLGGDAHGRAPEPFQIPASQDGLMGLHVTRVVLRATPSDTGERRNTIEGRRTVYTQTMIRLGYPAQNLTIPDTTNRTLRLASLRDVGRLKSTVRENIAGLRNIFRWNAERGVGLFRIGQDLVPFASHPAFPYDWTSEHGDELRKAGKLARGLGIRLSMHPGQYIQPASPRPEVAERGIEELRYVTRVFEIMGAQDAVTVLHMGGAYGDRPGTAVRFVETMRPHVEILHHLALENDERIWTVSEVADTAHALGIPAITDTLHHSLNPGGISLREALDLSLPTWEVRTARPKLHLSSQDPEKRPGAHAYSIETPDWETLLAALDGREADVMVEAKGKEQALATMGIEIG